MFKEAQVVSTCNGTALQNIDFVIKSSSVQQFLVFVMKFIVLVMLFQNCEYVNTGTEWTELLIH